MFLAVFAVFAVFAVDVAVIVEDIVKLLWRTLALLAVLFLLSCDEPNPAPGLYIDPLNGGTEESEGALPIEESFSVGDTTENTPPESQPENDPSMGDQSTPDPEPEDVPDPDPGDDPSSDPDPEGSVRFIRITTEISPSWVAWNEIEIIGSWVDGDGEVTQLTLNAAASASAATADNPPFAAIDGDPSTPWNAGTPPQAYLQIELNNPAYIDEVVLKVAQNPYGYTKHSLLFADSSYVFENIHVFEGETGDGDWLIYPSPPEVVPDPIEPCSLCLQGAESCDIVCQANDYENGECAFPDSTDASQCCECINPISPPEPEGIPFDLDQVTWLHKDVSNWPVTANLSSVTFKGNDICLEYDKKNVWPIYTLNAGSDDPTDVVANPWVFVEFEGQWYAGTWEWLRPGQTCKKKSSVEGAHIKQQPLQSPNWTPNSGDVLYFMVSGLARISGITNVSQRSNIVEVVWP